MIKDEVKQPLLVVQSDLSPTLDEILIPYAVIKAPPEKAVATLKASGAPVVLLVTTAKTALALLKEMLWASTVKIILVTKELDRDIAAEALSLGAHDCCALKTDLAILAVILKRAYFLQTLIAQRANPPLMQQVHHMVDRMAPSNISVLLTGESGTGKEVLARALHEKSGCQGPFVAINCAAIPETLLESELFGYEKGAFTGANKKMQGKIEQAHQGTLFLDEIGDLPLSLQPKLLRFLQERVIERLGGRSPLAVNVRVISATHHLLTALLKTNAFREDLYYRLSEVTITLPPLRARGQEIMTIANHLLEKFFKTYKRPAKRFSKTALVAILHYPWPGNIRELENKIKRAVMMADGAEIAPADLDLPTTQKQPICLKQVRAQAEKEAIVLAMGYCAGNVSKAAALLGITRPTLYHLIEKLKLADLASA